MKWIIFIGTIPHSPSHEKNHINHLKNGVSDGANGFHGNYDDDGIYVDMCVIKHY